MSIQGQPNLGHMRPGNGAWHPGRVEGCTRCPAPASDGSEGHTARHRAHPLDRLMALEHRKEDNPYKPSMDISERWYPR
jgi:hypothetical protein